MAADSFLDKVKHELNPVDLAKGLWDGAIGDPASAIVQLAGSKTENAHRDETWAYKAGQLGGMAVDFAVLSRMGGGLLKPLFHTREAMLWGKAAETVLESTSKMAVAGGVYGGLLTPSNQNQSLLTGRLEGTFIGATTGATMGATAKALESVSLLKPKTLWAVSTRNAIAGGASGVPAAYETIGFSEHRLAQPSEVLAYAGQNAAFGAAFGAADHGLGKFTNSRKVQEKHYSVKRDIEKKGLAAKYNWFAGLDKVGMRHPLQRAGDLILGGGEVVDSRPRAPLTSESNPATALKRDLVQYYRDMANNNELYYSKDKNIDRWELHKQAEELHAAFSHRVLDLWHGTTDMPGIKWHSDAELATKDMPADRVAKLRQGLMSTTRGRSSRPSPLDDTLRDFLPDDVEISRGHVSALEGIGYGRERFWNYNEDSLRGRTSMSQLQHRIDHDYRTPIDWSPVAAEDPGPRYYHGTTSRSLPSILSERTLWTGRALRQRALTQSTGESADEEWGRRQISLTRDFGEAFGYHRTSPTYIDDYPVVFGVSKNIVNRLKNAGSLEPGEQLIDKLRLGNSLWTRLGLRKPEITHMYVPDSEVPMVTAQLNASRIRGVQVTGFNDLQTPKWERDLTLEEIRELFKLDKWQPLD
ncbi:MAG TPA: hypothetical protein V6D22_25390 [Candidatus Obscuribacterales bacterium]